MAMQSRRFPHWTSLVCAPDFKLLLKHPYMMNLTFLYFYFAVKVISHLLWVCYILLAICILIRDLPSMTQVFGIKEEDQISNR